MMTTNWHSIVVAKTKMEVGRGKKNHLMDYYTSILLLLHSQWIHLRNINIQRLVPYSDVKKMDLDSHKFAHGCQKRSQGKKNWLLN